MYHTSHVNMLKAAIVQLLHNEGKQPVSDIQTTKFHLALDKKNVDFIEDNLELASHPVVLNETLKNVCEPQYKGQRVAMERVAIELTQYSGDIGFEIFVQIYENKYKFKPFKFSKATDYEIVKTSR